MPHIRRIADTNGPKKQAASQSRPQRKGLQTTQTSKTLKWPPKGMGTHRQLRFGYNTSYIAH